ncbi:MAG: hypothetical protein JWR11_915 [Mycobacterium sp.]|nr:hypothetical protein [Mycobacterium sp.]
MPARHADRGDRWPSPGGARADLHRGVLGCLRTDNPCRRPAKIDKTRRATLTRIRRRHAKCSARNNQSRQERSSPSPERGYALRRCIAPTIGYAVRRRLRLDVRADSRVNESIVVSFELRGDVTYDMKVRIRGRGVVCGRCRAVLGAIGVLPVHFRSRPVAVGPR